MRKLKNKEGKYFTGPLTLLELMALLAIIGLLLTWALHSFFSA